MLSIASIIDVDQTDRESMASDARVNYSRRGAIAYVELARPSKLNAFNDGQVVALADALEEFDHDDAAHVAILHGEGRAFSSGADVRERQLRPREELQRFGTPEARDAQGRGLLYDQINFKPVVAAAHGYVLGMAVGLLMECELAVATHETKFQITEMPRGLWASRYWALLQHRGGGAFADEVVFTGRYFSGREAAEHNLITASVQEGRHLDKAEEYATAMAANPPLALRAAARARRWYLQQHEAPEPLLRAGFPLHLSQDFRESASAWDQRRAPAGYSGG